MSWVRRCTLICDACGLTETLGLHMMPEAHSVKATRAHLAWDTERIKGAQYDLCYSCKLLDLTDEQKERIHEGFYIRSNRHLILSRDEARMAEERHAIDEDPETHGETMGKMREIRITNGGDPQIGYIEVTPEDLGFASWEEADADPEALELAVRVATGEWALSNLYAVGELIKPREP